MAELFAIDLQAQIACVEREIRLRQKVYPRWVGNRRMSQEKADLEIATMKAVLDTLRTRLALADKAERLANANTATPVGELWECLSECAAALRGIQIASN